MPARLSLARLAAVDPDDWCWIIVMAAATAVEAGWWAIAFGRGIAPLPLAGTYLAFACCGLAAALALRAALALLDASPAKRAATPTPARAAPRWPALLLGTALVGLAASLFLPLKYAIPGEIRFWLDAPLAEAERGLFGADPWLLLDRLLGGLLVPVDRVYALWLPLQSLILFSVILQPASPAKARALIAYALAWLILGVVAAACFSSAGPIFYDRLLGGHDFAALHARLRSGGAAFVLGESDAMWAAFANHRPGLVAGMSALPSLHVAISLWMFFAARALAPRLAWLALGYAAFIWLASVQLGWHYASDGLAAALGMAAIWAAARPLQRGLAALLERGGPRARSLETT